MTVSTPWPIEATPVIDLDRAVRRDLDAHGVERPEPALLDEHRDAGADFFAGRAPRAQVALQIVPVRRASALSSSSA